MAWTALARSARSPGPCCQHPGYRTLGLLCTNSCACPGLHGWPAGRLTTSGWHPKGPAGFRTALLQLQLAMTASEVQWQSIGLRFLVHQSGVEGRLPQLAAGFMLEVGWHPAPGKAPARNMAALLLATASADRWYVAAGWRSWSVGAGSGVGSIDRPVVSLHGCSPNRRLRSTSERRRMAPRASTRRMATWLLPTAETPWVMASSREGMAL